jgi:hypothetical protein
MQPLRPPPAPAARLPGGYRAQLRPRLRQIATTNGLSRKGGSEPPADSRSGGAETCDRPRLPPFVRVQCFLRGVTSAVTM